jgi:hypothetical protein
VRLQVMRSSGLETTTGRKAHKALNLVQARKMLRGASGTSNQRGLGGRIGRIWRSECCRDVATGVPLERSAAAVTGSGVSDAHRGAYVSPMGLDVGASAASVAVEPGPYTVSPGVSSGWPVDVT